MNESYFKYGEYVNLVGDPQLYIVVCTKHVSVPSGFHGYQYQIQDELGEIYRDSKNNSWVNQSSLRKLHQASQYGYRELISKIKSGELKGEPL